MVQAITGSGVTGPVLKGNTTAIQTQLGGSVPFSSITNPDYNNATGTIPKAYLSVVFFDERFNVISEGSTSKRVGQPGANAPNLPLTNIKAPKNGYCFVYVSNESDEMVYFDNLQVTQNHARIIEENHYYSYGLKIAAISSRKLGDANEGQLKNQHQYQGDFNEFDDEIGWNEFDLRDYDPQIGRFVQADPYDQFPSAYTGMGNNPVSIIDPSGGIGIPCPGTSQLAIFFMKAGEAIGKGLTAFSKISPWLSAGLNATRIGAEIYNSSVQAKMINQQLGGNMTQSVGGKLYKSRDAAAVAWAMENNEDPDIFKNEFSSVIFEMNDKAGVKRYGYTTRIKFEDNDEHGEDYNYGNSPGPDEALHLSSLPEGATVIDHIHSHTGKEGSTNNGFFSNWIFRSKVSHYSGESEPPQKL